MTTNPTPADVLREWRERMDQYHRYESSEAVKWWRCNAGRCFAALLEVAERVDAMRSGSASCLDNARSAGDALGALVNS